MDYLARELVIANDGRPNLDTEFPIREPPRRTLPGGKVTFIEPETPRKAPDVRAAKGGVSDQARAVIDSLQPHNRPELNVCLWPRTETIGGVVGQRDRTGDARFDLFGRSPLHLLRQFSNVDKHRHLHVTLGYVGFVTVSWRFDDPTKTGSRVYVHEWPFQDGAKVHFIRIAEADRDRKVIVNAQGRVEVAIQETEVVPEPRPVTPLLRKLIDFVKLYAFGQLAPLISHAGHGPVTGT